MDLILSPTLKLPLDAAARRLAILAMSGAGKSNVAVVLAEQMHAAGIPWVAIDPKGDWWGVRSSRDGRGPGLPVPIFGGLHADVKIEPTAIAGRELAEVIVAKRLTSVVDVSEFTDRQAMWAFLAAFGETLLHKNRQVLHLFLEEADEYLPQKTNERGNLPKCLGVWQRVVKRGRFRGLGSTQITQRSAALNKDTLYQAEALIALRATGKGDRDAVRGWVEHHNAAAEIVASLPTLGDGEGWFSSPAWLRITERVQFNRRRTFDSGSTPVLLEPNAKPATLADIDLDALRDSMSTAIAQAKADDPAELRKLLDAERAGAMRAERICEDVARVLGAEDRTYVPGALETAVRALAGRVERIEVPVITDDDLLRIEDAITRSAVTLRNFIDQARGLITGIEQAFAAPLVEAVTHVDDLGDRLRAHRIARTETPHAQRATGDGRHVHPALPSTEDRRPSTRDHRPDQADAPHGRFGSRSAPATPGGDVGTLSAMARAFLIALAQRQGQAGVTKGKILAYTGYRSSGNTSAQFAALVRDGLVDVPVTGALRITAAGLAALGDFEPLPTGRALRERVLNDGKLNAMETAFLRVLFRHYPRDIAKGEILAETNYASSGNTSAAFAHLVAIDYAVKSGSARLKAADVFFEEGR